MWKFVNALVISSLLLSAFARADDTELAKHMEVMEDSLKALRKSVKSADQNPASLESLTKMQSAALACKALEPAKAAEVPEAERAKFLAAYRKDMAAFIGELMKMEIALLDGDNAAAEAIQKELKTYEEEGHEKYAD